MVVLPAPLGPISPVRRAMGATRLTWLTAWIPPKRTESPLTSSPVARALPRAPARASAGARLAVGSDGVAAPETVVGCTTVVGVPKTEPASALSTNRRGSTSGPFSGARPPIRSSTRLMASGTVGALLPP